MAVGRGLEAFGAGLGNAASSFINTGQPNQAAAPSARAGNVYGVQTKLPQVGATLTKTYHGISITAGTGNAIVGRIQSWQPQMYSRAGVHVFEVGALSFARPVDYVPGNGQNYSISCSRTEMWGNEMELAFGLNGPFVDLVSQDEPFSIQEALFQGNTEDGELLAPNCKYLYSGCWFADKNQQQFAAEGDARVVIDATINFISRIRVL